MNWSKYPEAMIGNREMLNLLMEKYPEVFESINSMNGTVYFGGGPDVEGVDSSPEGIEAIRSDLAEHRNRALELGEMQYAVLMSHVLVLLAELKDIKDAHREQTS